MILQDLIAPARALLKWTQGELADKAGIAHGSVASAEAGKPLQKKTEEAIYRTLSLAGIEFLPNGVTLCDTPFVIIEGPDFYLKVLNEAHNRILELPENQKEILFFLSDDSVSPPQVLEKHREMRKDGIAMRKLVKEDNIYLFGPIDEYRYIPKNHFINVVHLVYGNYTVHINGSFTRAMIHNDEASAKAMRAMFETMWGILPKPMGRDENAPGY